MSSCCISKNGLATVLLKLSLCCITLNALGKLSSYCITKSFVATVFLLCSYCIAKMTSQSQLCESQCCQNQCCQATGLTIHTFYCIEGHEVTLRQPLRRKPPTNAAFSADKILVYNLTVLRCSTGSRILRSRFFFRSNLSHRYLISDLKL